MQPEIYDDIKKQINTLLAKNCLRMNYVYTRYLRYFKALKIRVQRLGFASLKDFDKIREIIDFQCAIDNCFESSQNIFTSYTTVDAMLALQDYRIKIFAPELQSFDKINLNLLEEKFRKIFFSAKA